MGIKVLYTKDRDQYLKQIKETLLEGREVIVPDEYKYLANEWLSSAKTGPVYSSESLTDSIRDMHTFERVDDFDKFRLAYLNDYYDSRDDLLGSLGCAIYYLDDQLCVYRKSGDRKILSDLRSRGLRLGSKLTENNVGKFVTNMAVTYSEQVVCRVGHENYLQMFTPYACFAHRWYEERRDDSGIMLVVTPVLNCSPTIQKAIDFILTFEDVTHKIYYPFTQKRSDYLESVIYNNGAHELYLDEHGEVVFVTKHFEEIFGKSVKLGPTPSIGQFMPELSYLTDFFDELRNPCTTREVMLLTAEKKHGFFQAIPEIIHTYNGQRGLRCTLQYAGKKKTSNSTTAAGTKLRYNFDSIVGESEKMCALKAYAKRISASPSNVLILGESGTGKELFAQAIHSAGARSDGPFVPINCASLPKDLLNSELFGYEEGAFTGASKGGAPGKFEQASGGTIFLDEIGDMPLEMQSALLRVLEDNTVIRIGGKKYIPVDIRVIAATNQNLWKQVQKGHFRADLYFRLNIVTINIPPLRDRSEDIPALSQSLLNHMLPAGVKRTLSPELVDLLKKYYWPGNVRELRNVIERCLSYSSSELIGIDQLPEDLVDQLNGRQVRDSADVQFENQPMDTEDWRGYNRDKVIELMHKYSGNKSKVAQALKISRATLYKRLREYNIN